MKPVPLLLMVLLLLASPAAAAGEVRVSAAASLAEVLQEVNADFEKATQIKVRLNLGGSHLLASQIREGAPADVFFSADESALDGLEKQGLLVEGTRIPLLANSLVVIVPAGARQPRLASLHDLTQVSIRRIAIGDPAHSPVGIYTRQHLEQAGLWPSLKEKMVAMDNVRAALSAVEGANVEAGIVYTTDARLSRKVHVAFTLPAAGGPRIVYPAAVLREARNPGPAAEWLRFLQKPAQLNRFARFGFGIVPPAPPAPSAVPPPSNIRAPSR